MKTIVNYLDELKKKTGSDNKTAQAIGMDRAHIAIIRKRNAVSDENAVKMAELLGIDPEEVLLAAAIARSEGKTKEAWERLGKKAGIAAGMILATMINHNQITDETKAESSNGSTMYITLNIH